MRMSRSPPWVRVVRLKANRWAVALADTVDLLDEEVLRENRVISSAVKGVPMKASTSRVFTSILEGLDDHPDALPPSTGSWAYSRVWFDFRVTLASLTRVSLGKGTRLELSGWPGLRNMLLSPVPSVNCSTEAPRTGRVAEVTIAITVSRAPMALRLDLRLELLCVRIASHPLS
jgi:hypothetical protein